MSIYKGVSISEYRLPVMYVIYIFLAVALVVAALFLLYQILSDRNKKTIQRIKKLRKKAENDEQSAKQLTKMERKIKRQKKKKRGVITFYIFLFVLVLGYEMFIIIGWIAPLVTDHVVKDYVVYTGEIKVCDNFKSPYIELEDGTIVRGGTNLTEEDTYGTVVYSRRSKIALGGTKINRHLFCQRTPEKTLV
ncbi:MAG: hypothetical protein IJ292_01850 [Clostridia bacterium]|nr:hypothetical protein [Clostridia bacterium]